jgi:hypothetical protein
MTMPIDWVSMIPDITWQKVANFFINLGITGVVFWGTLQFIAQKAIDLKVTEKVQEHKVKMDKQLEAYKTELQHDMKIHEQKLQVLTEEAKFKFNCLSQDYNMYSKERYTTYVAIRKKLLDAVSYTLGLRGLVQIPDFSAFSKKEVEEWLNEHNFGQQHKDSVLKIWDEYPQSAVRRLQELHKLYNEHTASNAYADAHNLILDSDLFISDELMPLLNATKLKVHELLSKCKLAKHVGEDQIVKWVEDEQALAKELPELLIQVTAQMKAELTYSDHISGKHKA